MSRIIACYGTRPEKIKMAPVIDALRARGVDVVEWCSGQSADLAGRGFVEWSRGLTHGVGDCMSLFASHLREFDYACVIVQGDTATAFACAQAAFLARVPVAHVEAGMRTYASEPWPEEAFRRQIAAVARWHFAPDADACVNLRRECGMRASIHIVGNTVIDTLPRRPFRVLATLHRRENWGKRIANAIACLREFSNCEDVHVNLVRHPNWSAHQSELPDETSSFKYVPPLDRDELLRELQECDLVVTDSGGLQEEAAHFGKSTLVLRTSTERVALERAGAVQLVHPDRPEELRAALESALARRRCYGDGSAGEKIADILTRELTRGVIGNTSGFGPLNPGSSPGGSIAGA